MATSVLDNGISIHDMKVRNLMIMADTREEFIQMLGRKRQISDLDTLDVYILQRDKNVLVRRLEHVKDCLRFFAKRGGVDFFVSFEEIMESEKIYSYVRNLCFVWGNDLRLNNLAFEQCKYLKEFYQQIIKKFEEEGPNAFIREQLTWLGKDEDYICEIIQGQKDRLKKEICEEIDKYVGKKMSKEDNLYLRESIRRPIKSLLEILVEDNSIDATLKKDCKTNMQELGKASISHNNNSQSVRQLACEKFNGIVEILDLKYKMEGKNEIKDVQKGEDVYCRIYSYKS